MARKLLWLGVAGGNGIPAKEKTQVSFVYKHISVEQQVQLGLEVALRQGTYGLVANLARELGSSRKFIPYADLMKGLKQRFLPLFTLYRNAHVFERGKRAGHSPLELAGIETPKGDWLEWLGLGQEPLPPRSVRSLPQAAQTVTLSPCFGEPSRAMVCVARFLQYHNTR